MKFIDKKIIEIDRELSELDKFTLDFIRILEKHVNYVLVSGYVSILLGRARASEDVDIIIEKIDFSTFQTLYTELKKHNYYCLNAEKDTTIFDYLLDNLAVRFAIKETIIPNVELKWAKHKFDKLALENTINVKLSKGDLKITHLELQIAFKEEILKSPKDIEDARHIRKVAESYLDNELINKYRESLREFYK
jgi:hypothetical protein